MSQEKRPQTSDIIDCLYQGEIQIQGQIAWGSNATFLVQLSHLSHRTKAIYKPELGERPLPDFPKGLYKREVAAYELSKHLGWNLVPETIIRPNGPYGIGSLQYFIEADFSQNYFTLIEQDDLVYQLFTLGVFDLIANNADRKASHCLIDTQGNIWGIDNGLCFHKDYKLRTVIWDFEQNEIPSNLLKDLESLLVNIPSKMLDLLSQLEIDSFKNRIYSILENPVMPMPIDPPYCYPWPLL